MHFTVVFENGASTYDLVYTPNPVWARGETQLVDLHRDRGMFERGDLKPLLESQAIRDTDHEVVLIARPFGRGGEEDLANLRADLSDVGYVVHLLRLEGAGTPGAEAIGGTTVQAKVFDATAERLPGESLAASLERQVNEFLMQHPGICIEGTSMNSPVLSGTTDVPLGSQAPEPPPGLFFTLLYKA